MNWRVTCLFLVLGCTEYGLKTPLDQPLVPEPAARPEGAPAPADTPKPGDGEPGIEPSLAGVAGQVCDPSGDGWVVGADVWIPIDLDGDGVEDSRNATTTDGAGRYQLDDLEPGHATVYIEKGSFTAQEEVLLVADEITQIEQATCLDRDSVNIAVVTGEYDDIGSLLDALTLPYDEYDGVSSSVYMDFLRDPTALADYDIIFLNCGIAWGWAAYKDEIATNLADYVDDGGSLYASDWAYWFVETSHPDMLSFYGDDNTMGDALLGAPGQITGNVIDANMQALLGTSSATLTFNYNLWAIPESAGSASTVLVTGPGALDSGMDTVFDAPLALRLDGNGRVVYTAFHNEAQATLDMELILLEIILTL